MSCDHPQIVQLLIRCSKGCDLASNRYQTVEHISFYLELAEFQSRKGRVPIRLELARSPTLPPNFSTRVWAAPREYHRSTSRISLYIRC